MTQIKDWRALQAWNIGQTGTLSDVLRILALPAMLCTRTRIGRSLLGFVSLGASVGAAYLFGWLMHVWHVLPWIGDGLVTDETMSHVCIVAIGLLGVWQHIQREGDIRAGVFSDRAGFVSTGQGWLSFLPLTPRSIGFIDPLAGLLVCATLWARVPELHLLGVWGCVSSAAFLIFEVKNVSAIEEQLRNNLDARAHGEIHAEVLAGVSMPGKSPAIPPGGEGMATGADDELRQAAEERRRRNSERGN